MNLFHRLNEVKEITTEWIKLYNEQRPHQSIAGLPPYQFAEMRNKMANTQEKILL